MRTLMLLILISCSPGLLAQQVVATAGSTLTNTNGSISYTIGEGIAQTLTKGDKTLTQGFHQSAISVSIVSEQKDVGFSISVFPNPASDYVILKIEGERDLQTQFVANLYDMHGKLLLKKKITDNETNISFKNVIPAIYLLKVTSNEKELKTFKIVKE